MTKLIVEVHDAADLMPKDGNGSSNPYVEVDFDNQKQKTQTRHRDLNPQWNQRLAFNVPEPDNLHHKTVEVTVLNEGGSQRNFLGRVRISGAIVPEREDGAEVHRYPLDKRGLFSHIKGDIALKMYLIDEPCDDNYTRNERGRGGGDEMAFPGTEQRSGNGNHGEFDTDGRGRSDGGEDHHHHHQQQRNNFSDGDRGVGGEFPHELKDEKKMKKEKEVRTFYSIPAASNNSNHNHRPSSPPNRSNSPIPTNETSSRSNFMRPAPPGPMSMHQFPPGTRPQQQPPPPNYEPIETRPPLAARMTRNNYYSYNKNNNAYQSTDKLATTYDLVEQMHYLYISIHKARDLPSMDITGSLDPYVEVRVGNYKGITKHLEKNQNPVWNQIFAFSKENLQANVIEVVVKDKDLITKDDYVGRILFDITEIPLRVPPDSPLAPQWYRLEDKRGIKGTSGELMLSVWIGTQGDEAFPESWHSDAHFINHHNMTNTRSKVYFSPRLYYLRVQVLEAQDLIHVERGERVVVKVQLGNQLRMTVVSSSSNPRWNDELMFVACEPFDEFIVVSVDERIGPGRDEILGRTVIPVKEVQHRHDTHIKLPESRWYNLLSPRMAEEEAMEHDDGERKRRRAEMKFSSKIHLRLVLESGYHVLDESTHFSSDMQPSSKHLRKSGIGMLEVGILGAKNLVPMKTRIGRLTDPYCVAKYGNKWIRTRTLLETLTPKWNEQYTWEVHDPCTVVTIGVFDNCQVSNGRDEREEDGVRDQRIGKVRIRLSTLEIDRVYTHNYPLLVLTNSGLKKHGELHLALRFTCTAWVNMVTKYGKPLLPKMHYAQPIPVRHIDWLRRQAIQIVGARLGRAEPPLRWEVVQYMLDVDMNMWSLRRSKANFYRIMSVLTFLTASCRWYTEVCSWRNPFTTILVHFLFLILAFLPDLILPTLFLYLAIIGMWSYRYRPRTPPHMDARLSQAETVSVEELDEEFDSFPTAKPPELVRVRYDRLRSIAGKVQSVVGDLATQLERLQSILAWRDPRATAIFVFFAVVCAVVLYVTPFQVVAVLVAVYSMRHPKFRGKLPSVPANFFKRLPSKSDTLL